MAPTETAARPEDESLSPLDSRMISVFVRLAEMLAMPRSLGEIYGLLFSSPHPLPFDAVVTKLRISTGSASQGLRFLRDMGAIRVVYQLGDRRDHYAAEVGLKMLVKGFLREKIEPHLFGTLQGLEELDALLQQHDHLNRDHYNERLELLRRWRRHAERFFPVLLRLLK